MPQTHQVLHIVADRRRLYRRDTLAVIPSASHLSAPFFERISDVSAGSRTEGAQRNGPVDSRN
jgi:hypothetical protein